MTWRKLNMLGYDMTGFRAYDLIRAVDLLEELQEEGGGPLVDKDRIGIAGLSGGCWLGIVMAALEPRVCAAALSGFFSTFKQTNWVGHCVCHHPFGEQRHPCRRRGRVPMHHHFQEVLSRITACYVAGIGALCEMPDIAGLISPRPLFIEWGDEDVTRPVQPVAHPRTLCRT